MPLIALNLEINKCALKGSGITRKLPAMKRASLRKVGSEWHRQFLPSHFTPGNEGRYGAMPRNRLYMTEIKKEEGIGQGRFVKLQLRGKSLRWMRAFPSITATSHQCTVRMVTPTYFDKPMIGSFIDPKTGRMKRITQQPDKPKEATAVNAADRSELTDIFARDLEMRVQLAMRGI